MKASMNPTSFSTRESHPLAHTLTALTQAHWEASTVFQQAAQQAWDSELREAFHQRAIDRKRLVQELQQIHTALELPLPEPHISSPTDLCQAWTDLKTALIQQDDQRLVEASAKAEALIVESYEQALRRADLLSATLRTQLTAQAIVVQHSCSQLQQWAENRRYLRLD